jgi:frataxin
VLSGAIRACRPAEPMSNSTFESLADSLLAALEEGIGPHADAELQGGVLTVEGDSKSGGGTWLVNKHAPTQQIWLSSPQSGARHYAFDTGSGQWKDTRGGPDLIAHLSAELGVPLTWRPQ